MGDGVVDQRMVSYEVSQLLKEEGCMLAQTEGGPKFRGLGEGKIPCENLVSKLVLIDLFMSREDV